MLSSGRVATRLPAQDLDDIDATVRELRDRGVVFEEYDLPGIETKD